MFKVFTCKDSPIGLYFARQGRRQTRAVEHPCRNDNERVSPIGLSHGQNCAGLTKGSAVGKKRNAGADPSIYTETGNREGAHRGDFFMQGHIQTNHCNTARF